MGYLKELVLTECDSLKQNVPCDFVGIALQNRNDPDITWPYAMGNRNEKYKYITVRYGKGIAGKVISSARPMEITDFTKNILGKITDYPIMLAEKLVAAYSVPLVWNGLPRGALLIGYRHARQFDEQEKQKLREVARKLESFLPSHFTEE
ncbi:two-component system, NarL family, sensor histidine kinase NreB/nitrogen regulatory protein A [Thalassobacillus cyri]|uniref:Two-component system, NarL family, sensor histidine kinase NreB/nitrogen regulatory protein A n=1 Tax=Thalassobacillus cyri TaxID=571932 RepID=A0A1H4EIZ8_9BACI|nr:GAF domain-containing protein [Thalassobacillus cyri]SEA84540.1 two-component system, NarL family, sensor histidine kinase NreB/nitrogen regulatory protein A [Thalassobacillus cyri]